MGNYVALQPGKKKKTVCGSCMNPALLDRDELAIHKEVGVPKGRLCIEAMKFLNPKERSLMLAAASSSSVRVEELLKSGAPADTYDENRTSPLHIACRQGSIDVVQELLDHRAAIDITDCAGWTSLHIASFMGRADVVALLLKTSADATIVNRNGETPWDLASDQATQQQFIRYWRQKSEEIDSPRPQSTSKILYDITAKKAFPRPEQNKDKGKVRRIKNWNKAGEYKTGVFDDKSEDSKAVCLKIFNNSPYKGLALAIILGVVPQEPSQIADFLFEGSLSPQKLGLLLSDPQPFYSTIADFFISLFSFNKGNLVQSLRTLLKCVSLPQENERTHSLIKSFSKAFYTESSSFKSQDSVENLVLSIVMLDFSLHEATSSPMTKNEFITSTAGMHDGEDFSEKYLSWVYNEVKKHSIRTGVDMNTEGKDVFGEDTCSGQLAYKCGQDWKEKFFVLNGKYLWGFESNRKLAPISVLSVEGLAVHFDTRMEGFTISNVLPITQLKLNDNGSVFMHMPSRIYFKTGNLKLWLEGFQAVNGLKIGIV